jgi:hypothetical protein
MADAFESAHRRLEEELGEELGRLRDLQGAHRMEMLAEEHHQQENLMKRLDLVTRLIAEEKLHPKRHEPPGSIARPTLPLISRTAANIQAASAMRRQTIVRASGQPLPLPPLIIKKRKRPARVAPE